MDEITLKHQQKVILTFLRDYPFDRVGDYLEGATRLQIARGTGIERATICRRVAELRERGLLHVHHEGLDPITNTKAEFLAL